MTTITIAGERLVSHVVTIRADSSAELVVHDLRHTSWCAIFLDGIYYDVIQLKHTIGRPETLSALHAALERVQAAIADLNATEVLR